MAALFLIDAAEINPKPPSNNDDFDEHADKPDAKTPERTLIHILVRRRWRVERIAVAFKLVSAKSQDRVAGGRQRSR